FMPGDAFFHTRLTQDVADSIPSEGGTVTLPYRAPDHAMGGLCGYAGFAKLEVRDVPPEVARGLKELHAELRKTYPKTIEITTDAEGKELSRSEVDAFRLFVTVKEFRPGVHQFGLKYNENWNSPPPEAMVPDGRPTLKIPAAVYECYVRGEDAVVADWRDAKNVPPLPVEISPYAAWGFTGAPIEQPAIAKAADARFFVLWSGDMRHYFREERNMRFWEVTPAGFRAYRYEKRGELKVTDVSLDDVRRAVDWDNDLADEPDDAEEPDETAENAAGPAEAWLTQ
ncbi:MAG TPA: hypothetical protein VF170_16215, partial [Planctomycetaceae bacterium]